MRSSTKIKADLNRESAREAATTAVRSSLLEYIILSPNYIVFVVIILYIISRTWPFYS